MQFTYTVWTSQGRIERGKIEATSIPEVVAQLKRQGRIVVDVKPVVRRRVFSRTAFLSRVGRVKLIDRVLLAKHLALMLRTGITINRAFRILAEQSGDAYLRQVLREVLIGIERGEAFADVLARFPRAFPSIFVAIVRWGEAGGTLPESLERLAVQFQKDYDLRSKVRGAMIYPAIVIGMTVAVSAIVSIFVLPRLLKIFESFELTLPLTTRILLFVAKFVTAYGLIVFPLILVLLVLAVFVLRSKPLRPFTHGFVLRLPIVGKIIREYNLARVDRVFGSLLRSGIPIVEALSITADATTNVHYRMALLRVRERARAGSAIGTTFTTQRKIFPPIQIQMVAVGEETGKLDEVLTYLADFYEGEVDATTKGLVQVLEPVFLIFVGLVVAGVALSIITPIYQLVGSFTNQ